MFVYASNIFLIAYQLLITLMVNTNIYISFSYFLNKKCEHKKNRKKKNDKFES